MKKFILKLIIFLIIIVVLDALFGFFLELDDIAEGGQFEKIHSIMTRECSDILVLGSSRAALHYDPLILEDSLEITAYNAGLTAQGLTMSYGFLKGLENRCFPRLILCEITPWLDISKTCHVATNYFYPYADNKEIGDLIIDFDPSEKVKLMSNAYRLNSVFTEKLNNPRSCKEIIYKGFKGLDGHITYDNKIDNKIEDNVSPYNTEQQVDSKKAEYLRKLIELAQIKKSKIYFFISPMYLGSDISYYEKELAIVKEYDCHVFNHLNDERIINNPDFFNDVIHLNKKGARVYTEIIAGELKKMIDSEQL